MFHIFLSKKPNPELLHNAWFSLHNIFEMTNFRNRGQVSVCQGSGRGKGGGGREVGVIIREQQERSCGVGTAQYLSR